MKKVSQSITLIIRDGKDFRATRKGKGTYYGAGVDFYDVKRVFSQTPHTPYKLTLTIDPKGKCKVECRRYGWSGMVIMYRNKGIAACFIPEEWDGLRVTRKVEGTK